MNDLRTLGDSLNKGHSGPEEAWDYDRQKFNCLEAVVHDALVTYSHSHNMDGWTADTHALFHREHKIRGLQFAEVKAGGKNTRGRHSTIFFQPEDNNYLVPGVIRKIFSIPQSRHGIETQALFLAVHRHQSVAQSDVYDPFKEYEEFGASLWSEQLGPLEIITPSQKMCHATSRRWQDGVLIMRPIDRVINQLIHSLTTMD